ncbi:glycosyltransferase family 2 protein [Plantactinospora sp. KBS50]|uniref:glycosyltransferase family 2 protein n=1 Tax=Plantactinospora sp. KBS50 TaxID=2024580 RepID=UPI000BAB0BB8|nr:glycosyltransferase family 2 protein [Plantactinospora sp. KBS50]ASW54778.1 hypothetical protein CIK06_12195 [Plantactinospora sp. KBS50]
MVELSVIVPARDEELTLPRTLPRILAAATRSGATFEVVVVVPGYTTFHHDLPVRDPRLRWLSTDTVGKFAALRTGVEHSGGGRLIFVDADVQPCPDAFAAIDGALRAGADVAAGRILLDRGADAGRAVGRMLRQWMSITLGYWHDLRTHRPDLRWALPGALYGLRREFFPGQEPAVPLLDDASIGLSARDRGARFAYRPDAGVQVRPPASYRQWLRQKVRTRRGWAALRGLRPAEVAELQSALSRYRAGRTGVGLAGRVMVAQDRLVDAVAWCSRSRRLPDTWRPDRSDWSGGPPPGPVRPAPTRYRPMTDVEVD